MAPRTKCRYKWLLELYADTNGSSNYLQIQMAPRTIYRYKWLHKLYTGVTCSVVPFHIVTRLIHTWDMTHTYVWHGSFICGTWLIHIWDMTHSYVENDSFICGTWLIHLWGMTHSYMWHDSFIRLTRLIHTLGMTHTKKDLCCTFSTLPSSIICTGVCRMSESLMSSTAWRAYSHIIHT